MMLSVLLGNFLRSRHMKVEGWEWRAALFQLTFTSCGNKADSQDQALPHWYIVRLPLPAGFLLPASTEAVANQVNQCGRIMTTISEHCLMRLPFGSCADLMNEAGTNMPKCSFIQLALSEAHLCACSVLSKATIWFLLLRATFLAEWERKLYKQICQSGT